MENINFYEKDVRVYVLKRQKTRENLNAVLRKLGFSAGTINYVFCSDESLLEINRKYLNHDTFTDIITFDYSESGFFEKGFMPEQSAKSKKTLSGDIYISLPRVKENAGLFHVKQLDELNRVLVHGILHLAGYKDKTPKDEKKMHEMEDEMLKLFHVEHSKK